MWCATIWYIHSHFVISSVTIGYDALLLDTFTDTLTCRASSLLLRGQFCARMLYVWVWETERKRVWLCMIFLFFLICELISPPPSIVDPPLPPPSSDRCDVPHYPQRIEFARGHWASVEGILLLHSDEGMCFCIHVCACMCTDMHTKKSCVCVCKYYVWVHIYPFSFFSNKRICYVCKYDDICVYIYIYSVGIYKKYASMPRKESSSFIQTTVCKICPCIFEYYVYVHINSQCKRSLPLCFRQ